MFTREINFYDFFSEDDNLLPIYSLPHGQCTCIHLILMKLANLYLVQIVIVVKIANNSRK